MGSCSFFKYYIRCIGFYVFDFFALSEMSLKFINSINESICNGDGEEKKMSAKKIEDVLKEHTNDLMSVPGVVGTGQGLCDGQPCIKVFVIKKTSELEENIPKRLEGYPVMLEETGEIHALPGNQK